GRGAGPGRAAGPAVSDDAAGHGAACVYTALVGGYERLNEQPAARSSSLDFVCLTDQETLTSETWRVVHVTAAWPTDAVRSARALKILGHPELDHYERTVWTDNSVVLRRDPAFLLGLVDHAPLALPGHWEHRSVLEEFEAVLRLGYDDPGRVNEQLNAYTLDEPDLLEEAPYASTVLVRRRCPELDAAMRLWMDHVLRYSRRDQLSLNHVLRRTGLPVRRMDVDLREADWAVWPHTPGRSRTRGLRAPGTLAVPPVVLAAEQRRRELDAASHLEQVTRERDLLRGEVEARSRIEAEAAARDGARADELARRADDLDRQIRDLRASRSWRVTGPMRVLAGRVRDRLGR
ncbi:MAG: glycosyltransferase domain-containing protein, partial [Acidimicrobiales bacterium]